MNGFLSNNEEHHTDIPVRAPPTLAMRSVTPSAAACMPACLPADQPSPASIVRFALTAASSAVPFSGARAGKISYKLERCTEI